jgi:hypothetical protein
LYKLSNVGNNCAGTEPNCYCAGSPLTSKYLKGCVGGFPPQRRI